MSNELRVVLVADTHGYLDSRIAELIGRCDYAVHAGDIGDLGVIAAMQPRCSVVAVRGNNDTPRHWRPIHHNELGQLGTENQLVLPGGRLVVVHGDRITPAATRHARLRERYADARVVVYGHSHRLSCDLEHEPWVLNPGAAGRARTFGGPSCILLTVRDQQWFVEPLRFTRD